MLFSSKWFYFAILGTLIGSRPLFGFDATSGEGKKIIGCMMQNIPAPLKSANPNFVPELQDIIKNSPGAVATNFDLQEQYASQLMPMPDGPLFWESKNPDGTTQMNFRLALQLHPENYDPIKNAKFKDFVTTICTSTRQIVKPEFCVKGFRNTLERDLVAFLALNASKASSLGTEVARSAPIFKPDYFVRALSGYQAKYPPQTSPTNFELMGEMYNWNFRPPYVLTNSSGRPLMIPTKSGYAGYVMPILYGNKLEKYMAPLFLMQDGTVAMVDPAYFSGGSRADEWNEGLKQILGDFSI